jgi:hypothetical protein
VNTIKGIWAKDKINCAFIHYGKFNYLETQYKTLPYTSNEIIDDNKHYFLPRDLENCTLILNDNKLYLVFRINSPTPITTEDIIR